MDDNFEKQRRNLLITSILLLVIQYAGVTLSEDTKLGIVSLHFQKPIYITYLLFLMHIFILYRYSQNFRLNEKGLLFQLYNNLLMIELAKIILPKHLSCEEGHYEVHFKNQEEAQEEREQPPEYNSPPLEPMLKELNSIHITKRKELNEIAFVIEKLKEEDDNEYRWQFPRGRFDGITNSEYTFSASEVKISKFLAGVKVFQSKSFFDNQFPYIVGIFSLMSFLYYIYSKII